MLKKILFTAASLFLIYYSTIFFNGIIKIDRMSNLANLINAWLLNMFITGIFAFASFAFPIENLLPQSYYTIHNPNTLKKTAQWLGIEYFRLFLIKTMWRSQKGQSKFFSGKKSGIDPYLSKTKKSEFGHLIPFIILLAISIFIYFTHLKKLAFAITAWNILGNLYPVLLQRIHRMRVNNIFKRGRIL